MKFRIIFSLAFSMGITGLSAQWTPVQNFNFHIQPGTLAALGEDTVIVASDNGNVHFSDDGGHNFSKDSLPFPYSWYLDIHFPSKTTGYLCGGTAFGPVSSPIAKTTDGGKTWDSISGNQFGYELTSVSFVDENVGFFGGQGIIVKTTDGGQTFTVDSILSIWRIDDLYFLDASTGFLLGNQYIYKTTNGGQSWSIVFQDTIPSFIPGFWKLDFVSSQVGFTLGKFDGKIIKTTDGGNTWNYGMTAPDSLPLLDFDFVNENIGYAIANVYQTATPEGRIYKTADGGQSWILQYRDTTQQFVSIHMGTANSGYVLGDSLLLATTNGGVGLEEPTENVGFDIYPNPASKEFFMRTASDVQVKEIVLTDISGKEVLRWQVKDEVLSYPVSNIQPGVYIVMVQTSKGWLQKKLVKY